MGHRSRRAESESAAAGAVTPRPRSALRRKLLAWYRAHRRDLPWRRTRDPYAIWISETMLQQTRVETVIPYWERFLARFPDVETLATADTDDVIALWAGLGYYSRARNLHRAAQIVMEHHAGRLPGDVDALRELPGVGRYTAGALASIAFDKPAPIVDGNVARVLARVFAIDADVRSAAVQERLWSEAEQLARGDDPGAMNQALMELGATVCTPRAPQCPACPWQPHCAARAQGRAELLPIRSRPAAVRRVRGRGGIPGPTRPRVGRAAAPARSARWPLGATRRRAARGRSSRARTRARAARGNRPRRVRVRAAGHRGARVHPPAAASARVPRQSGCGTRPAFGLGRTPLGVEIGTRGAPARRPDPQGVGLAG